MPEPLCASCGELRRHPYHDGTSAFGWHPFARPKEKWIRFVLDDHADPKKKTEQWHVISTSAVGVLLGDVKWYGGWRKYCFFPNNGVMLVFEEDCLRDIADFCVLQTKQYKTRKSDLVRGSRNTAPESMPVDRPRGVVKPSKNAPQPNPRPLG